MEFHIFNIGYRTTIWKSLCKVWLPWFWFVELSSYTSSWGWNSCRSVISGDWMKVRHLKEYLETFYTFTIRISGSFYIISNVHFQEISGVYYFLNGLMENENIVNSMAKMMKRKLTSIGVIPLKWIRWYFWPVCLILVQVWLRAICTCKNVRRSARVQNKRRSEVIPGFIV